MNRRVAAGLLAFALMAGLLVFVSAGRAPWTVLTPGPTINVLGSYDGKKLITIKGHQTYPDDGDLRLVTVYVTQPKQRISLWEAMANWFDPNATVIPHDVFYQPAETNQSSQQQSHLEMTGSQDNATAAALRALGIKFTTETLPAQTVVKQVEAGGPSASVLEVGDVLQAIDGKPVTDSTAAVAAISSLKPGMVAKLKVLRSGVSKNLSITTVPRPEDATKALIGVSLGFTPATLKPHFPFQISFGLGDSVGGPSAGMMFALSIYDLLTPGSLTGGKVIAGSGEISPAGVVSPIGGIGQKLVGAQRDGVKLFLVAAENCAEAVSSNYDRKKLRLVKVHTLDDAIKAVNTWRENPDADLPRCS